MKNKSVVLIKIKLNTPIEALQHEKNTIIA